MDYIKKTILLTNDKKEMCVLSLNRTNNGIFANIKNFGTNYDNCVLGICCNGVKVYKQNVMCKSGSGYDFKLAKDFDLNSTIACVLYRENELDKPILWGVNGDVVNYKGIISEYLNSVTKESVVKRSTILPDTPKPDVDKAPIIDEVGNIDLQDKEEMIDEETSNGVEEDKVCGRLVLDDPVSVSKNDNSSSKKNEVKECVEEDSSYTNTLCGCRDNDCSVESMTMAEKLFESIDEEVEGIIDKELDEDKPTFFEMISEQLDELFAKYPSEPNLEKVVPNSKWVKVNYEGGGREYVIGLIYELETLKYVAYGVPAKRTDSIPDSLDEYSQWLPLDSKNPDGEGYFVMFQDAVTGDSLKM